MSDLVGVSPLDFENGAPRVDRLASSSKCPSSVSLSVTTYINAVVYLAWFVLHLLAMSGLALQKAEEFLYIDGSMVVVSFFVGWLTVAINSSCKKETFEYQGRQRYVYKRSFFGAYAIPATALFGISLGTFMATLTQFLTYGNSLTPDDFVNDNYQPGSSQCGSGESTTNCLWRISSEASTRWFAINLAISLSLGTVLGFYMYVIYGERAPPLTETCKDAIKNGTLKPPPPSSATESSSSKKKMATRGKHSQKLATTEMRALVRRNREDDDDEY